MGLHSAGGIYTSNNQMFNSEQPNQLESLLQNLKKDDDELFESEEQIIVKKYINASYINGLVRGKC